MRRAEMHVAAQLLSRLCVAAVAAGADGPNAHKGLDPGGGSSPLSETAASDPTRRGLSPVNSSGWSFVGGRWAESPSGGFAAPGGSAPHYFAMYTQQCFVEFDVSFMFVHPVKGASDDFVSAGLIFGADSNTTSGWVLEFPTISHVFKLESFWVTLSLQRPDGWRKGIFMEQLAGVSSTPGLWHSVRASLICSPECVLRVSVDGNHMQPLMHGMPLRNGDRVALPQQSSPAAFIGLTASNGQAGTTKPAFRHLAIAAPHHRKSGCRPRTVSPAGPASPWGNVTLNGKGIQVSGNTMALDGDGALLMEPGNKLWPRSTDQGRSFFSARQRVPNSLLVARSTSRGRVFQSYRVRTATPTGRADCAALENGHFEAGSCNTGGPGPFYLQRSTVPQYGGNWSDYEDVFQLPAFPASWQPNGTFLSLTNLSWLLAPFNVVALAPTAAEPNGTLLTFGYIGAACSPVAPHFVQNHRLPLPHGEGGCILQDPVSGYEYTTELPPYGYNIVFRSTTHGDTWSMDKLDSNPARPGGPLGPDYDGYFMHHKSAGCETAAAPTADGGVIAFVRPTKEPVSWMSRAGPGGLQWLPLSRAPFPSVNNVGGMVRTASGVLVLAGQFPGSSAALQVSWDGEFVVCPTSPPAR
jgi:hypothetical protein